MPNRDFPLAPTPQPTAITTDSSAYYKNKAKAAVKEMGNASTSVGLTIASNKIAEANKNL